MLLATLPVRDTLPLIFLVGMTSATILEYVVGAAMEQIFHVRYWDYSTLRFHLNGYVCLRSSIGWGCASIALVKVIHPSIEKLILTIPHRVAEPLSLCLTVLFMIDVTSSVQSALDLKELLAKLSEGKRKLGAGTTHLSEAASQLSRRSAQLKAKIQELQQAVRTDRGLRRAVSILKRNPGASSKKYQDAIAVLSSLKPNRRAERNDAAAKLRGK